ncbi:polysaccharide deacetylase family protein [Hippea maritima]|uniref:Polysaccharide deacetylase n=1 Tax=Hippea maritima (strain ATCC 700847 / DSM 10411 / MH2) TaxID=760142 RepID=F2LWU6_HIPMA|nr:polysaccharide deacetylase family protein [Hippea maritima]AEA33074.1 polysaccharide deacetylase [Hippea maritima DSM 10411]
MKKLIVILFFTLLWIKADACVILIYHKVGDNRTPSTNVSIKLFEEQMAYLKEHGYKVMPLKTLVDKLKKHKSLSDKCVVLTFDDGYKSIYKNAFPIIKRYHYPITVFLPTEAIEKHYPDYLTLKQIEEMRKYGVDFQSHSYAHPRFTNPPKNIPANKYKNWIVSDLKKSIDFFKKHFGYKPYAFAIPYGDYNTTVIEAAKSMGFEVILTQDATAAGKKTPLWLIPRQPILGKYWSSMKHFKEVLEEGYLPVEKRIPEAGSINKNLKMVGAVIDNASLYDKNSFKIYTTQLGWQKAKLKGNLAYINMKEKLSIPKQRIGVMAKRNGITYKTLWMVWIKND